jgi:phosphatidate cytidylyltransferase
MPKNGTLIRVVSSAAGLPLLIAAVVLGGWWLKAGLAAVILVGLREVYTPLSGGFRPIHLIGYAFAAIYMLFLESFSGRMMFIPTAGVVLFCLALSVLFSRGTAVRDVVTTVFGYFYVAFLLPCVYLIRENVPFGAHVVWLVFISAWGCDTGAYIFGRLFGRRKLMPALSPKKTVEGAVGGVLAAVALALVYVHLSVFFGEGLVPPKRAHLFSAVICALGAVAGQLGDLAASAIKRYAKIKDFGSVIPGHGGVMDRFDSVLFTAPLVYGLALVMWR